MAVIVRVISDSSPSSARLHPVRIVSRVQRREEAIMRTNAGRLTDEACAPRITRDRQGLLGALAAVDAEGWDSPAGTALLQYVRTQLVRPLAIDLGVRGAAASQAEATAWEAVWVAMTKPSLRSAGSPWGVLWQVARRAVLGEVVAAQFATNERRARTLAAAVRTGELSPPIALEVVMAEGHEPASADSGPVGEVVWRELLASADRALVDVGWPADEAARIVDAVLYMPTTPDTRCTIVGWRLLAVDLGVPPWQARRLALALRGTAAAPGVLPLLVTDGQSALRHERVRSALLATRDRSRPSDAGSERRRAA
ncbi:hypothetical protein ACWFNE_12205 [Cellulomonas sp. NPDC055163]